MRNATTQFCVADNSVPAELRVLRWEHAVVMTRLLSKAGSRKHCKELLTEAVVFPIFIMHYVL